MANYYFVRQPSRQPLEIFTSSCGVIGDFTDIKKLDEGYAITSITTLGMGLPIPSHQEGVWVREDPKVVGGRTMRVSVDPFNLEP